MARQCVPLLMLLGVFIFWSNGKPIDEMIQDAMQSEADLSAQMDSNMVMMELDILMPMDKYMDMIGNNGRRGKRKAKVGATSLWPDGTVPYTISSHYSETERNKIISSMNNWERYTCVRFTERTTEQNFIAVAKRGGCYSHVGKTGQTGQNVSLDTGCLKHRSIIQHELGHAIGLWHEQSRSDRDDYVTINEANIRAGKIHNFKKRSSSDQNDHGVKYDYTSVMHYGQNSFKRKGTNGPTIISKDPRYQSKMGNSEYFTYSDVAVVNRMYQCSTHCGAPDDCEKRLGRPAFLGKDCICWCHLWWKYH